MKRPKVKGDDPSWQEPDVEKYLAGLRAEQEREDYTDTITILSKFLQAEKHSIDTNQTGEKFGSDYKTMNRELGKIGHRLCESMLKQPPRRDYLTVYLQASQTEDERRCVWTMRPNMVIALREVLARKR